jgi:ketosteroid isomerase-like protein
MQEQDNEKMVQDMYAAFGRGDVATIMKHIAPDVEWTMPGPESIPYAGRRVGHDRVIQFFQALATTQTDQKLTIDETISKGDKVVSVGRYEAVVTATGKRIDCAVAHVFTIRGGKVVKLLDFVDTAQTADAYVSAWAAGR